MLEHLMNEERTYGEPVYSEQAKEITQIRQQVFMQLNAEGRDALERMSDAYMRQETAVLHDAFAEGFWTAVELMLEFYRKKKA